MWIKQRYEKHFIFSRNPLLKSSKNKIKIKNFFQNKKNTEKIGINLFFIFYFFKKIFLLAKNKRTLGRRILPKQ
jgi:hypothetical protein